MYKDRLLRFGFELVEYIASLFNCEIEVIDNTEKFEQQELVQELIQEEESDGKSHKSNARAKQRAKQ